VNVAKNLMLRGSRPFSLASFLMASILGRSTAVECEETKMLLAWVAAKAEPANEAPAWKMTGVRWGEGSTMGSVSRVKYFPLW
jgi:hypothetical protein